LHFGGVGLADHDGHVLEAGDVDPGQEAVVREPELAVQELLAESVPAEIHADGVEQVALLVADALQQLFCLALRPRVVLLCALYITLRGVCVL
jgi:hypothetical protein